MPKVDKRPQFKKKALRGLTARSDKVEALRVLNTPEARKERKRMNVHVYKRGSVNTTGFYHPRGNSPVRCK